MNHQSYGCPSSELVSLMSNIPWWLCGDMRMWFGKTNATWICGAWFNMVKASIKKSYTCFFKFQPFHLFQPKSLAFLVKCSRNMLFGSEKFLGQIYISKCWHHIDTFQNCLLAKLQKLKAVSLYARSKRAGISLGVIRLDYHYPPAPGDVAHPGRNQMNEWLMHTVVHWR